MKIKHNDQNIDVKFFLVALDKAQPLINLQTCRDLELISIKNNVSPVIAKETEILDEYQDVFAGLGLVDGEFHIELRDDAKPTIHPPGKIPQSLMPKLQKTLEEMTEMGVISKVKKATDWVNSLVIEEKKEGSLRFCLDQKYLNKSIKREHYKPLTAETISSKLNGKRIVTVIDMSNCYWMKNLPFSARSTHPLSGINSIDYRSEFVLRVTSHSKWWTIISAIFPGLLQYMMTSSLPVRTPKNMAML